MELLAAVEPRARTEPSDWAPADAGQALVEYLFTIVFVAMVAMVGLRSLGPRVSDLMASITF